MNSFGVFFVSTSKRNQLLMLSQITKAFPCLENNFRRNYVRETRLYHHVTFYEKFRKTQKEPLTINRENGWDTLKRLQVNRQFCCNNVDFRSFVTKRNELKKKGTNEMEQLKECEKESKTKKEKVNISTNQIKNIKTTIESVAIQKKGRKEYRRDSTADDISSLNEVREKCIEEENNKNKNGISNLKKCTYEEINQTERETNSNEQKIIRNSMEGSINNTEVTNTQVRFHLKSESSTKTGTDVGITSFLKNKDQGNNAKYVAHEQTNRNVKDTIIVSSHVMADKTFILEGKLENKEFLTYVKKLKNRIQFLFEKHLLFMNCFIAGTLYFIADCVCQLMEKRKEKKIYDLSRTLRMAFIGITLEGPIMTWWYGKILSHFVKSKPNTFLYKSFFPTLFDNFIFGPIHLTVFFLYNGILKKQSQEEISEKIFNTGLNVFLVSLVTWIPLTLINFFFVPRIYQVTVVFFADFFWVIFLSWCANKKG